MVNLEFLLLQIAGFNGLSEAVRRLDFMSAVKDVRRFNYICALLQLLMSGQKLTALPGAAQKVLLTMLEEVAMQGITICLLWKCSIMNYQYFSFMHVFFVFSEFFTTKSKSITYFIKCFGSALWTRTQVVLGSSSWQQSFMGSSQKYYSSYSQHSR